MRPGLKTTLKFVAVTPLVLLALAIAVYLVLLFINRHDQAPSAAYLDLVKASEERPLPPDNENGFVFTSGFSAEKEEDPRQQGLAFSERQRKQAISREFSTSGESALAKSIDAMPQPLPDTLKACSTPEGECLQRLRGNRKAIKLILNENTWIIERYATLIHHPKWRETHITTLWTDFPPYMDVMNAQKLFLMHSWLMAAEGDALAAKEEIAQDHRFWRMVLSSTDGLVTRMIAVRALSRNYQLGNLAIQSLPAEKALDSIPVEWSAPYSRQEISMQAVSGGELLFTRSLISAPLNTGLLFEFQEKCKTSKWLSDTSAWLMQPLIQVQDSLNLQAESLTKTITIFDRPLDEYDQALKELPKPGQDKPSLTAQLHAYNPIGNWLATQDAAGIYADYYLRSTNLEGARRLALLMARLHAEKTGLPEIEAALKASDLKSPYTNQPFDWDIKSGYASFKGLTTEKNSTQYAFLYRP